MSTQTVLIGVAGLAVALGAYTVLSGNPTPWKARQPEPEGDPADWSRNELKAWLENVSERMCLWHFESRIMGSGSRY